jgi:hypothetical protein
MDTNLTQVTQAIIESLQTAKAMDSFIDSTDSHPTSREGTPASCTFTMTKDIDHSGSHQPLGQIVYTCTVTAEYRSFDE